MVLITIYYEIVLGKNTRRKEDDLVAIPKYRAVQEAHPHFTLIPAVSHGSVYRLLDIFIADAGGNRKDIELDESKDEKKDAKNASRDSSENSHAITSIYYKGFLTTLSIVFKNVPDRYPPPAAGRRIAHQETEDRLSFSEPPEDNCYTFPFLQD